MSADVIGRGNRVADLLGRDFHVAAIGRSLLRQNEFIAAHANDQVTGPGDRLQAFGDLLEQGVTDGMAETIVGGLEMVEVDGVNRHACSLSRDHVSEVRIQHRAIEDARHRVETGELFELLLERDMADGGFVGQADHFHAGGQIDRKQQAKPEVTDIGLHERHRDHRQAGCQQGEDCDTRTKRKPCDHAGAKAEADADRHDRAKGVVQDHAAGGEQAEDQGRDEAAGRIAPFPDGRFGAVERRRPGGTAPVGLDAKDAHHRDDHAGDCEDRGREVAGLPRGNAADDRLRHPHKHDRNQRAIERRHDLETDGIGNAVVLWKKSDLLKTCCP